MWKSLKEHSTFLEMGSFYNSSRVNSYILQFFNKFSRSPGLAVALLA